MIVKSLLDPFFARAKSANLALVFTTFSLNEEIVVRLLKKFKVSDEKRIVVFHDVMKHHAPGLLLQHYRNSLIVSVQVVPTRSRTQSCPVFHSKIWMGVERTPLRCQVLAAPSLNLSDYHLDRTIKTLETFPIWVETDIPLNKIELMSKDLLFEAKGQVRRKVPCATFLIDARNGTPHKLRSIPSPAIDVLERTLDGEEPVCCAAPFVSQRAVRRLFSTIRASQPVPIVWYGERADGTRLHAKLIATRHLLTVGSTNVTCQALGIGRFLNHETVVVLRRRRLSVSKVLRGFQRVRDPGLLPETEEPGDIDEYDSERAELGTWSDRHHLAVNGPSRVQLFLTENSPEIRIVGSLHGATRITLLSSGDNEVPPLTVAARSQLRFSTRELQLQLARLLLSSLIEVRGYRRHKLFWMRELDCGSFWGVLETTSEQLREQRNKLGTTEGQHDARERGTQFVRFTDVRQARQEAHENPKLNHEHRLWHAWLARLDGNLPVMPLWCIDLAARLRKD